MGNCRAVPRLSADRERALLKRCAAGDSAARETLTEQFLPLAHSIARRYTESGEPYDDLFQVACLGLVKALDRFDPDRGVSFTTFAVPTMLGEIKRHFRDRTWVVHVPRSLNESSLRADEFVKHRTQTTGRAPTVAEIAQALELNAEEVLEALEVGRARRTKSLDATPPGADDDTITVGDTIPSPVARRDAEARDARLVAEPLLRLLEPREELILRLRFERDLTQDEIGQAIGVSQMQVSRLLRQSIERLHTVATAGDKAAAARVRDATAA